MLPTDHSDPASEPALREALLFKLEAHRAELVKVSRQVLRKTIFSNRTELRPREVDQIADWSVDIFIQTLRDPAQNAMVHGMELSRKGLSSEALFELGQTYWLFNRDVLGGEREMSRFFLRYLKQLIQGYFDASQKSILAEQESFRLAFQTALDRSTTEMIETKRLAQIAAEENYRNIIQAQENERRKISRELHDEAGQLLIGLRMSLTNLLGEVSGDHVKKRLRLVQAIELADGTLKRIREISYSLRPPVLDLLGINLTIKQLCLDFSEQSGLLINYTGMELPRLQDELAISLYRIAQEALTNIIKHSEASQVWVDLKFSAETIHFSIRDNGQGFDPEKKARGIGLAGMQDRMRLLNGSMKVQSSPGKHTHLKFEVPMVLAEPNT